MTKSRGVEQSRRHTPDTGFVPRQCRGKVRHAKRKQALSALNGHLAAHPEDDGQMEAYRCGVCRGWHIGHSRVTAPRVAP